MRQRYLCSFEGELKSYNFSDNFGMLFSYQNIMFDYKVVLNV